VEGAVISPMDRFSKYVTVPADVEACWPWHGSTHSSGFGFFRYEGRVQPAHRVSWKLQGIDLMESQPLKNCCGNKGCVNPGHWDVTSWGTLENLKDLRKFTKEQVAEIRELYSRGESAKVIAKKFGTSAGYVQELGRYVTWSWA